MEPCYEVGKVVYCADFTSVEKGEVVYAHRNTMNRTMVAVLCNGALKIWPESYQTLHDSAREAWNHVAREKMEVAFKAMQAAKEAGGKTLD
jgi:hypothetical protein